MGEQLSRTSAVPGGSSDRLLGRSLALHVAFAGLLALVATLVWAATPAGPFWPAWVWFGVGTTAAGHAAVAAVAALPPGRHRALLAHAVFDALVVAVLLTLWVLTSRSSTATWWPVWPVLGLGAALAGHALVVALSPRRRASEAALSNRVAELTRTRRDAVDVQATELRRIERDLHDGAQARLVALSLQLGRAQRALSALEAGDREDPPAAAVTTLAAAVGAAREHADAAIAELRELVQGIAPPILTDRGLAEAVRALGRRAGVPVGVVAEVERRPPAAVEVAAYFVVAEAVTNAVKHAAPRTSADGPDGAPGSAGVRVEVEVRTTAEGLLVQVSDDGRGGADPAGSGLHGLAQRVAALDGSFAVTDGPGGGTVVRALLPTDSEDRPADARMTR